MDTVRKMKEEMKYNMYVVTNGDERSVEAGLKLLGLSEFFDRVFGSRFMGGVCKPETAAFEKV